MRGQNSRDRIGSLSNQTERGIQNIMRTKFSVDDLRTRLVIRLAVAPRHWFKTLWSPQSRPHQNDAARQELVAFITHGWDSLEIEAIGPEHVSGAVPGGGASASPAEPQP